MFEAKDNNTNLRTALGRYTEQIDRLQSGREERSMCLFLEIITFFLLFMALLMQMTYGIEHVISLQQLEDVGMLKVAGGNRSYPTLKKSLKLVVEDVQEQSPNDIAFVHSGYAPLTVRLLQFLERQQGWRGLEEVLKLLPGPTIEETQHIPPALLKKGAPNQSSPSKMTLVYFIGGCTYSEIAALRFLAQQENAPTDYVIATTKIINGGNLIDSLLVKPPAKIETKD